MTLLRASRTILILQMMLEVDEQCYVSGCSGLSPEIVHFRIPSDGMDQSPIAPHDWYIKGAR